MTGDWVVGFTFRQGESGGRDTALQRVVAEVTMSDEMLGLGYDVGARAVPQCCLTAPRS